MPGGLQPQAMAKKNCWEAFFVQTFLAENLGTLLVGLAVAGIIAAIVIKMARDKKKGRHAGCNCGCEGCPGDAGCHTK
jgi:mannose/fructose/N-acetylgalactosamine-specific phosphotransferase system component IIC